MNFISYVVTVHFENPISSDKTLSAGVRLSSCADTVPDVFRMKSAARKADAAMVFCFILHYLRYFCMHRVVFPIKAFLFVADLKCVQDIIY